MKIIEYKDHEIGNANPFDEAAYLDYDGKKALTNGHLMFTNPADIPSDWNFKPHQTVINVVKQPKPRMPECVFETRPLVVRRDSDADSIYFDKGQRLNLTYFDAVMNLYPTAEWFTEEDEINTRLEAKRGGETVATVMPLHTTEYPEQIADRFAHLASDWFKASDDYSEIQIVNAVFKPFAAFKTKEQLKEHLKKRVASRSITRRHRLDELAEIDFELSSIGVLIEKL